MNSKSKIIAGLASIIAVSAGVAATSSYAWFSTQRTAVVTVGNILVNSPSGDLSVKAGNIDATLDGVSCDSTGATVVGTGNMSDISGDGKIVGTKNDFYQPVWLPKYQGLVAQSFKKNVANTTTIKYYREFKLTIKNGSTDTTSDPINVYITSGCLIEPTTPGTTADVQAAKAMRVGIYSQDGTTPYVYWANTTEPAASTSGTNAALTHPYAYNYMAESTTGTAYGTATTEETAKTTGYVLSNAGALSYATVGGDFLDVGTQTADTTTIDAKQKLTATALAAQAEQIVRVRIWLEGTSTFCTNDALGGSVKFTLSFAALTVAA
jgi:hypothetical protein